MDFGAGTDFWEGMCGFRRVNGSASGWGPRTGETSESPPLGPRQRQPGNGRGIALVVTVGLLVTHLRVEISKDHHEYWRRTSGRGLMNAERTEVFVIYNPHLACEDQDW